jgi:phenylpropionate dioxygenase-like ring-hydroxylating dioxygenase large terminal subunit
VNQEQLKDLFISVHPGAKVVAYDIGELGVVYVLEWFSDSRESWVTISITPDGDWDWHSRWEDRRGVHYTGSASCGIEVVF